MVLLWVTASTDFFSVRGRNEGIHLSWSKESNTILHWEKVTAAFVTACFLFKGHSSTEDWIPCGFAQVRSTSSHGQSCCSLNKITLLSVNCRIWTISSSYISGTEEKQIKIPQTRAWLNSKHINREVALYLINWLTVWQCSRVCLYPRRSWFCEWSIILSS